MAKSSDRKSEIKVHPNDEPFWSQTVPFCELHISNMNVAEGKISATMKEIEIILTGHTVREVMNVFCSTAAPSVKIAGYNQRFNQYAT